MRWTKWPSPQNSQRWINTAALVEVEYTEQGGVHKVHAKDFTGQNHVFNFQTEEDANVFLNTLQIIRG